MRIKYALAIAVAAVLFCIQTPAQDSVLKPGDLKVLEGKEWVGELTYLDYSSNKKTSIKSNIIVTRSKSDSSAWTFDKRYPLEPKANKASEVKLSPDGKTFDGETVIERTELPGGVLKVVTTQKGTDNDREALFRYTYLISKKAFSIKKEAKVNEAEGYFERNTYSWKR